MALPKSHTLSFSQSLLIPPGVSSAGWEEVAHYVGHSPLNISDLAGWVRRSWEGRLELVVLSWWG